VSLSASVLVVAPPDEVWSRWTSFTDWPAWNPACVSARVDGVVEPGTRLHLELRHPRGRAFLTTPTVTDVESGSRIAWETRALGIRAPTVTTLEPHDVGTLVRLTSESSGMLGFTYRLTFPEKTQAQLWSGALTGLARSYRPPDPE
jgi:uncharacterized protein YndB with AHSA1/START domain